MIVCGSAQKRQGRLLQLAASGGRAGGPGGGQPAAVRRLLLHGRAGRAAAVGAAAARRGAARAAALPGGRAALLLPAHALPLLRAAPQGRTLPYPVPWAAARPRLPAPARSGAAARAPLCALALSRLHSATAACSHTNAAPKGACCARGTHPALLLARARCAPCCGRRRGSPVCCGAPPTRRCRRGCRTFGKGLERAGGVQTPSPTLDQQPLTGRRWCRCCTW